MKLKVNKEVQMLIQESAEEQLAVILDHLQKLKLYISPRTDVHIDDVKAGMSGLLSPDTKEEILGLAEVKDVFKSSAMGAVAGCQVVEGIMKKGNPIRVLRDNIVIYEGELESLRRHKDDVKEVKLGTECGIAVKNYNDVKPGDNIEVFQRIEVARQIE